jgi:zinc/manganese transport system substrate-binding protein
MVVLASAATLPVTACQVAVSSAPDGLIPVASSISPWGSILVQLGGDRVRATSIISNPATDPHDYEPSPADARTIAVSRLFVENGIGYDGWAAKSLSADPDSARRVVDVGTVTGISAGGNPHRWYAPADVTKVAETITAALTALDPAHADYYRQRNAVFTSTGLAEYHALIADIRRRYAGVPIGASESIVSPLADALGLTMETPASFLRSISEGADPTAADKRRIDEQIATRQIAVYLYNSQNATPDVSAQVDSARKHAIAVVAVTETLPRADATFEQWQVAQLRALSAALHEATGR